MELRAAECDTNSFSKPSLVGERIINTTMLEERGLSEDNSSNGQHQTNQHRLTLDFGTKNKSAYESSEIIFNETRQESGCTGYLPIF